MTTNSLMIKEKQFKKIAITIKTTNACNMRCKHCYHALVGYDNIFLDIEKAKQIIDLAIADGYTIIDVLYMGGEPTLWGLNNFISFLKYQDLLKQTKSIIFKNTLQTNGLLLDNNWFLMLKENNFNLGISFDGNHNDVLREKSEVVFSNINNLKKNQLNFRLLCVETSKTIDNLIDTYRWFNSCGLDFKILPLFISGEASKHLELELDPDKYVDNFMKAYKFWIYDLNCNIDVSTFREVLSLREQTICNHRGATCVNNRISISPTGDIYPCGRPYTDDFNLGHINSFASISEIFNSVKYKRLVEIYNQRLKKCSGCEVFSSCLGGCISDAILEGYYSEPNNPYCIRTKKMILALYDFNKNLYEKISNDEKLLDYINPRVAKILKHVCIK
ncbi:Anaerobic sulfatase-maturating enzyme [Campylobacter devanensis]|uniref:radical SAM/SPASM domain-containing protein n=1 Tax=Campylobacter devanensis TaxID=3161138 RepID=UPI000E11C7C5|nr:radical SAM protein [Campylobacter lanienae]SUX05178.1 Anaerobic sulfatase-maturating enzyme [Campylobacter lanienae]